MRISRTCRAVAAAAVCALALSACGGGGAGGAAPESSPAASASPKPTTPGGQLRAALDHVNSRAIVLRAARALSAARFNSIADPGADRDVARKLVQAACADLAKLFEEFDATVVGIDFPSGADTDVGRLLAANRALIRILDQYATATEGHEFATINDREVPATKAWENAVKALVARVDPGATAAPTPTAAA